MTLSTFPTTIAPMTTNSVVTKWLPLTTTFTAPDRCSTKFLMEDFSPDSSIVAYDPNWGISVQEYDICQPAQVTKWYNQPFTEATVTSIGPFVCPQSWEVGATSVISESVTDELDRVTLSICCPPGYTRDDSDKFYITWCSSAISSGDVLTYETASQVDDDEVSFVAQTTTFADQCEVYAVAAIGGNYGYATATASASGSVSGVNAAVATGAASTSAAGAGTGASTSTAGTRTGTATSSSSAVSKSLSTGAVAGIGVGVAAAALGLAALAGVYFWRRRSRMRANAAGHFPPSEQVGFLAADKAAGGGLVSAAAVGATAGAGVGAAEPFMKTPEEPEPYGVYELPPESGHPLVELYGGPAQPAELS